MKQYFVLISFLVVLIALVSFKFLGKKSLETKPPNTHYFNKNHNILNVDFNLKSILDNAADGAIIHLKAGVYLIDSVIKIQNKSLIIYGYGSTFKMQNEAGYNAVRFAQNVDDGSYKGKLEWYGGAFDGNRDYQNSPVAHLDKENKLSNAKLVWQGHGNSGLLTVVKYQSVIIKDVTIQNNSGEGVVAVSCKHVLYKDCNGKNGLPISQNNAFNKLNTGESGHQWTYFKVRSEFDCHAIWDSVYTEGGSIGIHYSSNHAGENSLAEIKNCVITNPSQDAVHIEHCENLIIDNLKATGSLVGDSLFYRPTIHVGNECKKAYIHKLYLQNGFVDFRNGTKLKMCEMNDFTIISDAPRTKSLTTKVLTIKNGTISGKFNVGVYNSDSVINVSFISTAPNTGVGISAANYISNCSFDNLFKAGNVKPLTQIINPKVKNCGSSFNNPTKKKGKYF